MENIREQRNCLVSSTGDISCRHHQTRFFKCWVKREKSRSCFPSVRMELLALRLQPQLEMFPHTLKVQDTTPHSCVTVSRAVPLQGTQPSILVTAPRVSAKAPVQPEPGSFRQDVLVSTTPSWVPPLRDYFIAASGHLLKKKILLLGFSPPQEKTLFILSNEAKQILP